MMVMDPFAQVWNTGHILDVSGERLCILNHTQGAPRDLCNTRTWVINDYSYTRIFRQNPVSPLATIPHVILSLGVAHKTRPVSRKTPRFRPRT